MDCVFLVLHLVLTHWDTDQNHRRNLLEQSMVLRRSRSNRWFESFYWSWARWLLLWGYTTWSLCADARHWSLERYVDWYKRRKTGTQQRRIFSFLPVFLLFPSVPSCFVVALSTRRSARAIFFSRRFSLKSEGCNDGKTSLSDKKQPRTRRHEQHNGRHRRTEKNVIDQEEGKAMLGHDIAAMMDVQRIHRSLER